MSVIFQVIFEMEGIISFFCMIDCLTQSLQYLPM